MVLGPAARQLAFHCLGRHEHPLQLQNTSIHTLPLCSAGHPSQVPEFVLSYGPALHSVHCGSELTPPAPRLPDSNH